MKIAAVIVTFHPDPISLKNIVRVLRDDSIEIIVVDNTQDASITDVSAIDQINFISIGKNIGIAAAQNIGISRAVNADVVIFFDQDSIITPGFVPHLCSFLEIEKPQIVAPIYMDIETNKELPSIKISKWGLPLKMLAGGTKNHISVDIVISSGTAATSKAFQVAGVLLEPLYIDLVDIEWCLRCRSFGIPIKVIPTCILFHRIGSGRIELMFKSIHIHNYSRSYYQIRNTIWLFRFDYVPKLYIIRELLGTVLNNFFFILTSPLRKFYLSALVKGFYDGLSNRLIVK